ncbi:MAG: cytochrome C [Roseivirga sp.]|nr:cytochrome C [Roseivirga sp.]
MQTKKRVKVFIDDASQPVGDFLPPVNFQLDTTKLTDGEHSLKIIANSSDGIEGIRVIPFTVRNGPQIDVDGLKDNEVVDESIDLTINAYGSESQEQFLVSGSETPKAVPSWLWVLLIGFVSWGIFYLVSNVVV